MCWRGRGWRRGKVKNGSHCESEKGRREGGLRARRSERERREGEGAAGVLVMPRCPGGWNWKARVIGWSRTARVCRTSSQAG